MKKGIKYLFLLLLSWSVLLNVNGNLLISKINAESDEEISEVAATGQNEDETIPAIEEIETPSSTVNEEDLPEEDQVTENIDTNTIEPKEENLEEVSVTEENKFPSSIFYEEINGTTIIAKADEGVFPLGTTMVVSSATDEVKDIVENLNANSYVAYDITFYDIDKNEIQPNGNVEVSFNNLNVADETKVYHVDDNNVVEQIASEVSDDAVLINTDSFSIYIILNPAVATYKFFDNNGMEITEAAQIVKNGEYLSEPNAPTIEGYFFDGWYSEPIGGIKTDFSKPVEGIGSVDEVRNLYAVYKMQYYVFFMDYNKPEPRLFLTKEGVSGNNIYFKDVLIPLEENQKLIGWSKEKDGSSILPEPLVINNENVTLYPVIETGQWLTFDTLGGTYIYPVFYEDGTLVGSAPANPSRDGYTFDGWYKDVNYTEQFQFGSTVLDKPTTVYAKWNPNSNTKYTIAYWIENADNTDYSIEKSIEKTGTTDTAVVLSSDELSINNLSASYRNYFTYKNYDLNKTVAGDGTTVVNVYFSRNVYTVKFDLGTDENNVMTINNQTFTGNSTNQYTITAKYNAYIGDIWPTAGNFQTGNSFRGWYDQSVNMSYASKRLNFTGSLCNENGKTLSAIYGATILTHLNYMFESFDQTSPENGNERKLFNGVYYDKDLIYSHDVNSQPLSNWKQKEINGMNPVNNGVVKEIISNSEQNIFLYYSRKLYTATYRNFNTVVKTENIPFDMSLTGKFDYVPDRPAGIPTEYVFKGWYTTENFFPNTDAANIYTKMPDKNIIVYAKWEAPSFNVNIYSTIDMSDNPTVEVLKWGEKIPSASIPSISALNIPEGSQFLGWYLIENGVKKERFYPATEIYQDTTIAPYWVNKNFRYTITYDLNGGVGDAIVDPINYAPGSEAYVLDLNNVQGPSGNPVFLGWENDGMAYQPGTSVYMDKNIVLKAKWGIEPLKTTLRYNSNNGLNQVVEIALENNGVQTVKSLLNTNFTTLSGYRFLSWNTAADGSGTKYMPDDLIRIDVNNPDNNTLYAIWEKTDTTSNNESTSPKGRTCQDDGYPEGYYWDNTKQACVIAYKVPDTADENNLVLYGLSLIVSGLGLIVLKSLKRFN